jgi:O-antigen/teichoic acid export membrane protein
MDSGPEMAMALEVPAPGEGAVALPSPSGEGRAGAWGWLVGLASAKNTLALVDQAAVSGTNFLTTILIGRWCSAGELGIYSLGFSLLVAWACAQEALIALPYTICRHRPRLGTPAEYAGSALVHQALLSALAVLVLVLTAAGLSFNGHVPGLAAVAWVLGGVMPFALLREFGRRFAFAHLRMGEALALDVAVAGLQLAGLATLALADALSAPSAIAVVGAACAAASAVWLYLARKNFTSRWGHVWPTLRQSWALGKWLFASQVTLSVRSYFIHWLLAWMLGATATGVYVACLTVVLFSSPFTLGISNALAPRAAQTFTVGGAAELRRVVLQTTLLLGAAMVLFCAVVALAGDDVMALLYRGQQYKGHGHTITVLALVMLASHLGMPASNGLAAIERPELIFKVELLAVVLSAVLIPCLVAGWGVTGAAYGSLAGSVAASLGRWVVFSALLHRLEKVAENRAAGSSQACVSGVLRQLLPGGDPDEWLIEQINEGGQASIFVARRLDGRPLWQAHQELVIKLYKPAAHQELVIKLYKPAARLDGEVVRRQFQSLVRLHARLDGRGSAGWRIHVPAPVYQCDQPPALVMTAVPGRSLKTWLESPGQVPAHELGTIAEAVVAAMEYYWSSDGQIHGDLDFGNVLCDLGGRSLSFVDPGVFVEDFLCEGVSKRWYPASRDLAYLLYDAVVTVKRTFGNPGARQRQQELVEAVLRVFLNRLDPASEGYHAALDEIHACVRAYLDRLRAAPSPRGLWYVLLRRIALRRLDQVFGRLKADGGAVT